jgi:hypothetical protein
MEHRRDLRKFITELPVAQGGAVLSSGREAAGATGPARMTVQRRTPLAAERTPSGGTRGSGYRNVGWLTPGAGIASSTAMGSDLSAAEALQEAETEVGVG